MSIHIYIDYPGGVQTKLDGTRTQILGGKAIIELEKDQSWRLTTTPGGSSWWPSGVEWRSGFWKGDTSRSVFNNTEGKLTFVLRNFEYPPETGAVNDFYESWIIAANPKEYTGKWQPILTDELLKATLEKWENLQREIIEMGIQGGLDAVSILDPSGVTAMAAGAYGLSRGDYVSALFGLVGAIPIAGKFLGSLPGASRNAARIAKIQTELKTIETALKTTSELKIEGSLNKISQQKLLVNDAEIANTCNRISKASNASKSAKTLRNSPNTVRTSRAIVNKTGMFRGDGHILVIPEQLANTLKGRSYKKFRYFREAFWKEVAKDQKLAQKFAYDKRNLIRMQKGKPPIVPLGKQVVLTKKGNYYKNFRSGVNGGQSELRQTYVLHHKTPIHDGGGVYDMSNILVVTPRYHLDILYPKYHYKH